jgi:glutamine synthetase
LGANEAPPAIISVFLGDLLSKILNEIEAGAGAGSESPEAAVIKLGISKLPEVMKDNTDRNRTSPFAFTGNKFEFRAVGSSASTAFPVTIVNAAIADGVEYVTTLLKSKLKSGKALDAAILDTIREVAKETKAVRFEGNGYSEDWVKEAAKRGLPNLRKTPEALAELVSKDAIKMFTRLGVFTEAEITSRYHVRTERYIKNLMIEVETLKQMVDTFILPAVYDYQGSLASSVAHAKAAGVSAPQMSVLTRITTLIESLQTERGVLDRAYAKVESQSSEEEKAKLLSLDVSNAMSEVRRVSDELEALVGDDYWPFPKYREMLFLS